MPGDTSASINDTIPISKGRPFYPHFTSVLLVGEADFSFARALARQNELDILDQDYSSMKITATEYGSVSDVTNRYFEGDASIMQQSMANLQEMNAIREIVCGINVRLLGKTNGKEICTGQKWNAATNSWDNSSPFWATVRGTKMFDLIIFNFPHSNQAGRAAKLIQAFFKQVRLCVDDLRMSPSVVVEMRLRDQENQSHIRTFYRHIESASSSNFELIGVWESDLAHWEALGYSHKWTKKNQSCRDLGSRSHVWRWKPAESRATGDHRRAANNKE